MAVSLLISETTSNWCRNLGCRSDSVKQTISLKICVSWNQLVSYTNPLASGCKVKWGEEASLGSWLETILLKCICGHSLPQTTNLLSFLTECFGVRLSCRKIWKDFSLGKYENSLWQMQDKRHGKSKSKENVGGDVAHLYCSLHCCNSPVLLRSCIIFTMFHLLALPRHYFPGDFCLPDDYDKAFPPAPRPANVTIVSSLLEVCIPPCIMKSIFCILEFSVNVKRT